MSVSVSFWLSESGFIRPGVALSFSWVAGILIGVAALLGPSNVCAQGCHESCRADCVLGNCKACCDPGENSYCWCDGGNPTCGCS